MDNTNKAPAKTKFDKLFAQKEFLITVKYSMGGSGTYTMSGEELYQAFVNRMKSEGLI